MATSVTTKNEIVGDETGAPTPKEQYVLVGKIAVGAIVGVLMMGVIGPIVLAIVIGLATGH
ncbi:MAG TPA: hypothetical protein VE991_07035 [Acidimicrobiales bacterium]|nr:hypothetical protein [Acidimicrobiales bacterium]